MMLDRCISLSLVFLMGFYGTFSIFACSIASHNPPLDLCLETPFGAPDNEHTNMALTLLNTHGTDWTGCNRL
jgi:hypothetical protein